MEVTRISRIYENVDHIDQLHLKDTIVSLNLHGNALLSSSGLLRFGHLVELDLSANSIKELVDFDNLQLLVKLNLSSNLLESVSAQFTNLTSLDELNLSYNLLTRVNGLEQCPGPLTTLSLHGNALNQVAATLATMSVRHLTLDDGTSPALLFSRIKSLQTLDGLNRHGERDDRQIEPVIPKRPTRTANPWEQGDGSNHEDHVPDIRHHVLKATENLNSKYESAQLETQSKIAKLEATIEKLTMDKKPLPKMIKSKVTKKPCLSCGKLFDEVKGIILKVV